MRNNKSFTPTYFLNPIFPSSLAFIFLLCIYFSHYLDIVTITFQEFYKWMFSNLPFIFDNKHLRN